VKRQRRKHRGPVRTEAALVRFTPEERQLVGRAAAAEARVVAQFLRVAGVERAARVCAADRPPAERSQTKEAPVQIVPEIAR